MTREEALRLMQEFTPNESLRRHMYAVEAAMRFMAHRAGADPEQWGLAGLLHDFDYERWPNPDHSPVSGHPSEGVKLLRSWQVDAEICDAIMGHAAYTGVARTSALARTLFAVDELCGFVVACALVRPSRSLSDLEVASVVKKLKDKAFARGVSRDDVHQGAAELGVPLPELIGMVLEALRPYERELGLGV